MKSVLVFSRQLPAHGRPPLGKLLGPYCESKLCHIGTVAMGDWSQTPATLLQLGV
jgi:hypothetical protein